MYFQNGRCAHCNNEVTYYDQISTLNEFNQIPAFKLSNDEYLGQIFFCKRECFDAEMKKRVPEIPSRDEKREDERYDKSIWKGYKDESLSYHDLSDEIIADIERRMDSQIAEIRLKRRERYAERRQQAFQKGIRELCNDYENGKRDWRAKNPIPIPYVNPETLVVRYDINKLLSYLGLPSFPPLLDATIRAIAGKEHPAPTVDDYYAPNAQGNLGTFLEILISELGSNAQLQPGTGDFNSNLLELCQDPISVLRFAFLCFYQSTGKSHVYKSLCALVGVIPSAGHTISDLIDRINGVPIQELVNTFALTPIFPIFRITVPKTIPEAHWYSHCLLIAQTRFGKTNIIRWRLNQLLAQIAQGQASVVMMEPKGRLTEEVLRLAQVRDMSQRVVILDPKDTRVSVNIFDKGDGSDHAIQETIARVARVLNTITSTLTPFQNDALMYSLRAMFCVDEPGSMRLLTGILRRGIKELPVRNLPYVVQEFFAHDFKPGDGSSAQVVARLNGLLANPAMEALFAADRSTFDMFTEMQAGKLIVINASAADNVYARFWIEQVAATITHRFDILKRGGRLMPTTFIIDEAQTWVSEDLHFASILDKAAEARIGMLIACHHMDQIKDVQVRGSIYTNTALKFAAHTSQDIYALCRSMGNTTPDFIGTLKQYEFAYFGPDMDKAIKAKLPLVEFDKMPQMSEAQYQQMRKENRRQYNYDRQAQSTVTEYDECYADVPPLKEPTLESVRLFLQSDVAVAATINFRRDPEQTFLILDGGFKNPDRAKHIYANYRALIETLNDPPLLKTFMEKYQQYAPQPFGIEKPKQKLQGKPDLLIVPKSPPPSKEDDGSDWG